MKRVKIRTYEDFKMHFPSGFTETSESANIPSNTYTWNDTYKAFRIYDNSTSLRGAVELQKIINANFGDVVEITAEVMNISGVKAKLSIDYQNNGNMFILQSEKVGEFEKIGGRFTVGKTDVLSCVIGVFTADIGDFYVRNIEIKVEGNDFIYSPDIRAYTFFFDSASVVLQTVYHPYKCNITVSSTDILIEHGKPFNSSFGGSAIASLSATGVDYIIPKTRSESSSSVRVEFINTMTGATINPTTLYGTNTFFSVIHHGYSI